MSKDELGRVEFTMRRDDAELLRRVARSRYQSLSELIRDALYDQVEPLRRVQAERVERTNREIEERRQLAAWNAGSGGDNR